MKCWIAENVKGAGPCDGRLRKCHLIPKQRIAREARGADVWDPRCWVWICGGPTGVGGHHGALDYSRTLRIPRRLLPDALEEFAAKYGLTWSLDRDYGQIREVVPLDPIGHMQARQAAR